MNCSDCKSSNILFCEGYMMVCGDCGVVQDYVHFVEEDNHDDLQYVKKEYKYKCITYFKRLLRCMQDKSAGTIPEYIIELVRNNPEKSIREVLHYHKLFEYYICIPQIDYIINKNISFNLNEEEEDKLYKLFCNVVEQIHEKFPDRNQIVRYKPLLRMLLPLIGRHELIKYIPDLKNKSSRKRFNQVMEQIII